MKRSERDKLILQANWKMVQGEITAEQAQEINRRLWESTTSNTPDPEDEGEGEPKNFERDQMESGYRG
jgi:hypothetical protein